MLACMWYINSSDNCNLWMTYLLMLITRQQQPNNVDEDEDFVTRGRTFTLDWTEVIYGGGFLLQRGSVSLSYIQRISTPVRT